MPDQFSDGTPIRMPRTPGKSGNLPAAMANAMAAMMVEPVMYHPPGGGIPRASGPRLPRHLQGIDIEAEYKLIQDKKSKLSANQRKAVVAYYERTRGDGSSSLQS